MGLFDRITTGRTPKMKFIKKAIVGDIVYARHDIPGLLGVVPGGTRGILLNTILRDRRQRIVVRWDGFGNGDAIAADLSPHFDKGSPELAKPPARAASPVGPSAADQIRAAVRDGLDFPRISQEAFDRGRAAGTPAATPAPASTQRSQSRRQGPPPPASRPRTVTQIIREEPYDPSKPQEPEPPLRPGETRHVVIVTDEPM